MIEESSGDLTSTPGTEQSLFESTRAGTRVLIVDLSAVPSGATVTLSSYVRISSGGTLRRLVTSTFSYGEADPGAMSIPVAAVHGCQFSLTQTGGTAAVYPWSVSRI